MSTAKNAILRAKLNDQLVELLVKTNAAQVIIDEKGTTLASHLTTLATSASVEELKGIVNALTGDINKLGALAGKNEVTYDLLHTDLKTLIDGKANQSDVDEFISGANEMMEYSMGVLNEVIGDGTAENPGRLGAVEGRLTTAEGTITEHGTYIDRFAEIVNIIWNSDGKNGDDVDTNKSIRQIANEELVKQLIIDDAEDKLDTLQQIADWIQNHPDSAAAMNQAISDLEKKVELGTYVDGEETKEYATVKAYVEAYVAGIVSSLNLGELAGKDKVSQTDLDDALAESFATVTGVVGTLAGDDAGKSAREIAGEVLEGANLGAMATKDEVSINELSSDLKGIIEEVQTAGPHTHDNKPLLDTYRQTEADLADAVLKKHTHANAEVLNAITSDRVNAWDAKSDSKIFYTTTDAVPEGMGNDDLWFLIIED